MKQFIYPYIMFEDTKAAAKYYVEMFDAKIIYQMLGKDTPNCPEDLLEKVMHLQLEIKGHQIYMADANIKDHGRVHIHLDYDELSEMEAVFNKFALEGTVIQELGETFWGAVFGNVIDKFNVTWQFHYSLPKSK